MFGLSELRYCNHLIAGVGNHPSTKQTYHFCVCPPFDDLIADGLLVPVGMWVSLESRSLSSEFCWIEEVCGLSGKAVTIVLPNLEGGGVQRQMLNIASGLADAGVNVTLIIFQAKGRRAAPLRPMVPSNARMIDFDQEIPRRGMMDLIRYLRKERPPVVMSGLEHVNVITLVARALCGSRTRVIATVHNMISKWGDMMGTSLYERLRGHVHKTGIRITYPWADMLAPVSQGLADDVLRNAPAVRPERVRVTYNPLISEGLLQKSRCEPEHPWFQDGVPIVLAVGRLNKQKNFANLISAFAATRKSVEARLLILGEGEDRAMLEQQVTELGLTDSVSMPGFLANPYACMARAHVLALSSDHEGLPSVLIEALACGTPVISTDCPSGPSEILQNGRYGVLVPVGDSAALSQALTANLSAPKSPPPVESWQPYKRELIIQTWLDILADFN